MNNGPIPTVGWIGVDLDGTLAEYHGWAGADHIGKPIPKMVEFVKDLLDQGETVKIMTARVGPQKNPQDRVHAVMAIRAWCMKVFGRELPTTHEKDFAMIWLYDDRCTRVEKNTGAWFDPGHAYEGSPKEAELPPLEVKNEEQPGITEPGI